MHLEFPATDPTPLKGSHLAVAVCQVRHESHPDVSNVDFGLEVHEALGGRSGAYARLEPQELHTGLFEFGPGGFSSSDAGPSRGWRLRTRDGAWTVTLMPDHFSLETTAYTSWADDFRVRLQDALDALDKVVKPRARQRLGLRYINRLPLPESGQMHDWQEQVAPELLGVLNHSLLGPGVRTLQQQIELQVDDEIDCVFRHGTLKDANQLKTTGYLLDYDVFTQEPERFGVEKMLSMADRLNSAALAMFQTSLTPAYLATLRRSDNAS